MLSRILIPEYVLSKRGSSYVENARQHKGDVPLAKTDIAKFYPSTTRPMVMEMFVREFRCAKDIAGILADICCYQQSHLPTGSPISGRVAYLAGKGMFDEVNQLAIKTGSKMTVYVDDITISGPSVNKRLITDVRAIIRKHGLKTKRSKTKTFAASAPKHVTGAVIVGDKIRLPNMRHKKIKETRSALGAASGEEKERLARSLKGRLQEAKQVLREIKEG